MSEFDFESGSASTDWLTSVLTRNGHLVHGEVIHVRQEPAVLGQGSAATFFNLKVRYSPGSGGDRPESMLLKVANPAANPQFESALEAYAAYLLVGQSDRYDLLQKEPTFYEAVRTDGFPLPVIDCYGTAVDDAGHRNCLLLRDMSGDWGEPLFPLPPSEVSSTNTVRSFARIHAHWWGSDRFGSVGFPDVTPPLVDEAVAVYRKSFEGFAANIGDRLSRQRRDIYAAALDALPRLLTERFAESDLTLIHGDAHPWNVLTHNETQETVIYDWQTWHVDFGAHDLAYLMALGWFPERRHRLEAAMLDAYLEELLVQGVSFSTEQLRRDYQLSIIRHLLTPVLLSQLLHPAVWWPHIDRIFSAFEDWECSELL